MFFARYGFVRPVLLSVLLSICAPAGAVVTCDQLGNLALATEKYRNDGVPLQVLMAEADKLAAEPEVTKDDVARIRKTVQESYDRTRTPLEIRSDCKDVPKK